jgi:hypothetical protein
MHSADAEVDVPASVAGRTWFIEIVTFTVGIEPELGTAFVLGRESVDDLSDDVDVPLVRTGETNPEEVVDHVRNVVDRADTFCVAWLA